MRKRILSLLAVLSGCALMAQQGEIDLSGQWELQLDPKGTGEQTEMWKADFNDTILLPGSLPERLKGDEVGVNTRWIGSITDSTYYISPRMAKYREPGNIKFPFFLTPARYYMGAAWFRRTIDIPGDWKGQKIEIFLERPHIESTVWIDGKKVGTRNSMVAGHSYDITKYVKAGQSHSLTVRVDNNVKAEYDVGLNSHSVSDQTQGNWNGIVGEMILKSFPNTYFSDIQIYPDIDSKKAEVRMVMESEKSKDITVSMKAVSYNSAKSHSTSTEKQTFRLKKGTNSLTMTVDMGDGMLLWDEFEPNLYHMEISLDGEGVSETKSIRFGMRKFIIDGKHFMINGRETIMRGTVECCDFPMTGYAPMDLESWLNVFRKCKAYGLNHMRFHSYCPPAAAFEAADLVGFYLQPEGPSWPNYSTALGIGRAIDTYLMEETKRMSKEYGTSPSFCMLACGNEPSGNWVEWVSDFVDYWKATDSRRVYTGASVGGSWAWQPKSQYHVKAGARGLTWSRERPETVSDHSRVISEINEPYVAHEMGQWCVFPNFDERSKYTGVNKAYNFDIFKDFLEENGMGEYGHQFFMSSGKLQALCYKHDIEKMLRTKDYAGMQLLSINDYSGQGSALVGVTDVFFDSKEYISPEQWRRFCCEVVPLARIDRFVYRTDETLRAAIEIANYGRGQMNKAKVTYTVRDEFGLKVTGGTVCERNIQIGRVTDLGNVVLDLGSYRAPARYNLEIAVDGTPYVNDWDFWVYPQKVEQKIGDVLVTKDMDEAISALKEGRKVLILGAGKVTYGAEIRQQYQPVFWNTSWFKMRPPHTTGVLVRTGHRAFSEFPTESWGNMQWWELLNGAAPMRLSDFPLSYQPLIHSIDTWFLSRKAGMLIEGSMYGGKFMMTTMDLESDLDSRVVARQMLASLLDYMNGDYFRPESEVAEQLIRDLYVKKAPPVDFGTRLSFTE